MKLKVFWILVVLAGCLASFAWLFGVGENVEDGYWRPEPAADASVRSTISPLVKEVSSARTAMPLGHVAERSMGTCVYVEDGREIGEVPFGYLGIRTEQGHFMLTIEDGRFSWGGAEDGGSIFGVEDEYGALDVVAGGTLRDGVVVRVALTKKQVIRVLDRLTREPVDSFTLQSGALIVEGSGSIELLCARGWSSMRVSADGYAPTELLMDRSAPEAVFWMSPSGSLVVQLESALLASVREDLGSYVLEIASPGGRGTAIPITGESYARFEGLVAGEWNVAIQRRSEASNVTVAAGRALIEPGSTSEVKLGVGTDSIPGSLRIEVLLPTDIDCSNLAFHVRKADHGGEAGQGDLVGEVRGSAFQYSNVGTWVFDLSAIPSGELLITEETTGAMEELRLDANQAAIAFMDLSRIVRTRLVVGGACQGRVGGVAWSYASGAISGERRVAIPEGGEVDLITLPRELHLEIQRGLCRYKGMARIEGGYSTISVELEIADGIKERALELRSPTATLAAGHYAWYGLRVRRAEEGEVVQVHRRYGGWEASKPLAEGGRTRYGCLCFIALEDGNYIVERKIDDQEVARFSVRSGDVRVPVILSDPALIGDLLAH